MFTSIFVCVRTIFGIPASIWFSMKIFSMSEVSFVHKGIWIIAALGITFVSQLFSRNFVKESIELVFGDIDVKKEGEEKNTKYNEACSAADDKKHDCREGAPQQTRRSSDRRSSSRKSQPGRMMLYDSASDIQPLGGEKKKS